MIHETHNTIQAREGEPRVIAVRIRTDTPFLTFAGEREGSTAANTVVRYAIVGTDYGWLHTSAGDKRFWRSRSGAARFLRQWNQYRP